MPIPNPVRLFHITAIVNLEGICKTGALLSKSVGELIGIDYQNIAHAGAQGARAAKEVPSPPGGTVHDYVPFYFAPRSPMLSAIENGRVADCNWRQADIVHLETTVERVTSGNSQFLFFDRNATLSYSRPFTSLDDLKEIAWDLLTEPPQLDGFCKYFADRPNPPQHTDRRARRQAEFLVKTQVPLTQFTRIGVINDEKATQVSVILEKTGIKLRVEVKQDWYFLGQQP